MIERLISGGQTGADKTGLEAARALGIPTGGTAPKGWRIYNPDGSDGSDPSLAEFGLVEHSSRDYPPRTKQNIIDSDGTVWFGRTESFGGKLTIGTAKKSGKPIIINPTAEELRNWIAEHDIKILNVAGNRANIYLYPDIRGRTYTVLTEALR